MGNTTKIEWADKTWSPWMGCSEAGPGCDHCYAKAMLDTRQHKVKWGPGQPRVHTENWDSPLRWNKQAAARGHTIKVFPSVCDPFDNEVPPEWRQRFFNLIRDTPHLTWLLLTKRVGNAARMIAEATEREHEIAFALKPWPNVWVGATVVNQQEADRDIPKLLATPAAKRFVSIEPMLGAVDLGPLIGTMDCHTCGARFWPDELQKINQRSAHSVVCVNFANDHDVEGFDSASESTYKCPYCEQLDLDGEVGFRGEENSRIDWIIAGGESGPHARPSHPDWYRDLRDQCAAAGVPFLFKQWGEFFPVAWFDGPDEEADAGDDLFDVERKDHVFLATDGRTWDTNGGRYMYPPMPLGHWCLMGKIGKKAAGRQLDGREHLEFPPGLEPYVSPPEPAA
jgi:protein gp37